MTDAPSRSQDKFIVRLPAGMRDAIATAAERAGRSMNAEIVQRLEDSFSGRDDLVSVMLQLQGAMVLSENTIAAVKSGVAELQRKRDKGEPWEPRGHQNPSIDVEIEEGLKSVAYFEKELRMKGYALQHIAEQRAAGKSLTASELRKFIADLGISIF